jgi:hypothetical protein
MGDWQEVEVDLGGEYGSIRVQAREPSSGHLEWHGLPGTALETWKGAGPRTDDSIEVQIQQTAYEWIHDTKQI